MQFIKVYLSQTFIKQKDYLWIQCCVESKDKSKEF